MTASPPSLPIVGEPHRAPGLLVAELFGPTFQGEGRSVGQQAMFVRLSRCNLSCGWCDEPQTWDWSRFDLRVEARRLRVEEIAAWALSCPVGLVVVTGGEPLLQQPAGLVALVERLAAAQRQIEIETNGTVMPDARLVAAVTRLNVSPKLSGAGGAPSRRLRPEVLRVLAACGKVVWKFVVTDRAELAEIAELQAAYGLAPVWVMPQATTSHAVLEGMRWLAEETLARGWHLSPRLHVLLWEGARGR